jgi:CIC family chloride channel protein
MSSWDLLACVGLGIGAGLASVALARTLRGVDEVRLRWLPRRLVAPFAFGLGVGLIGLVAPAAIGEGYGSAQQAIDGELVGGAGILLLVVIAKIVTTGLTLGSGSPGGIFAPCLVIGSILGASYARMMDLVLPQAPLGHEGSYALVGMSGLVAGVMQAPLTGIFLVMEVTRGYEVILPLMIVSVVSLLVARRFETNSLYTLELARHGELLRPGTDRRILADVALRETLDAEVVPIGEDMTLAEFAQVARRTRRNHFPVLRGEEDRLVGMLDFGAVRELVLDPELARLTLVGTVMEPDVATVPLDANLSEALEVFEQTGAWVLPAVDEEGHFAGLISKSTLFDRYRKELSVQRTT